MAPRTLYTRYHPDLTDGRKLTYLDSISILVVQQGASSLKNRRTSALDHLARSLAGMPYTKRSYSQP